MSTTMQFSKTVIGTIFLIAIIFLAGLLAFLGVVYNDAWAKGGVGAAVIVSILLYWSITKEQKPKLG